MPKRKSEDIEGQKHRGPTLLTYFPKVSRRDSNSEGLERPSQSVGDSDSSETVDKSASEHPKGINCIIGEPLISSYIEKKMWIP